MVSEVENIVSRQAHCVLIDCVPVIAQVQQQAALMASVGQGGGYLSPMAAFAAAQMQHMATINGLPGAPLTPTSGEVVFTVMHIQRVL